MPRGDPLGSTLPMDDQDFREIVEEFVQRTHQQWEAMKRAWADRDLRGDGPVSPLAEGRGGNGRL